MKVVGTMNLETLDGRVRFERSQRENARVSSELARFAEADEEPIGMSDTELAALRRDGLPI